ncbi:MAG TPA: phosphodiester glycosidase family protein [Planktothrix sp.]|jgi:exopolysaccharide biosynthesis protein
MSQQQDRVRERKFGLAGALFWLAATTVPFFSTPADALGVGVIPAHAPVRVHVAPHAFAATSNRRHPNVSHRIETAAPIKHHKTTARTAPKKTKAVKAPAAPAKPLQPQSFTGKMEEKEVAPGVVHKFFRGPLSINVLDIDMQKAPVKVQPALASNSAFNQLKDVADVAKENHALAAINANYFKKDGTPLGTLIIDGEWVAGPLYDRVSMGITNQGKVKIDRVSLGGVLTSNNPELPKTWVNNINQPHRSGCHLFAYTHRWGSFVRLPGVGTLVALDAHGNVVDKSTTEMGIPWGGYVLADSKDAPISKLKRGDIVNIQWETRPAWDDVAEAVSGGPMLIKDGNLYVDLKDEKFRKGWTGSQIHARTVAGVTANNHLLLATIEGPHTLWDIAKFMKQLGAVDAMNLDGGGSTTMVVDGNTVTRGAHQRRVVSSIVVLDMRKMPYLSRNDMTHYQYSNHPAAPSIHSNIDAAAQMQTEIIPAIEEQEAQLPSLQPQAGTPIAPVQVQGIATPPEQSVNVPVSTRVTHEQPLVPHQKSRHFFGLIK